HTIASRVMQARQQDPNRALAGTLAAVSTELAGAPIEYSEAALTEILSPRHFVNVRRTLGGPAPEETARAAQSSRALLDADRRWWAGTSAALTDAERRLADRAAAL